MYTNKFLTCHQDMIHFSNISNVLHRFTTFLTFPVTNFLAYYISSYSERFYRNLALILSTKVQEPFKGKVSFFQETWSYGRNPTQQFWRPFFGSTTADIASRRHQHPSPASNAQQWVIIKFVWVCISDVTKCHKFFTKPDTLTVLSHFISPEIWPLNGKPN